MFAEPQLPKTTIKPMKKVMKIDKLAVFIEMKIGDQSVISLLLDISIMNITRDI